MHLTKKSLFTMILLLSLAATTLLTVFIFGYINSPFLKGADKGGGTLLISSVPEEADVFLGRSRVEEKSPAEIKRIKPGIYDLKVSLKGYRTWDKRVAIKEGQTIAFDKIILIPDEWETWRMLPGTFANIIPLGEKGYFIVTEGGIVRDFLLYSYKEDNTRMLIDTEFPFLNSRVLSYYVALNTSAIILYVAAPEGNKYIWVDFSKENSVVRDLTGFFPRHPLKVEWTQENNPLFAYIPRRIIKIDFKENKVFPDFLTDIRGYGISNDRVYALRGDATLSVVDFNRQRIKPLIRGNKLGGLLFGEKEFFHIEVFRDDHVFLVGEDGKVLSSESPFLIEKEGVKGLKLDPENGKVLLWKDDRIGILEYGKKSQPYTGKRQNLVISWIYTGGKNIEQCFSVYGGKHVLFRDGDSVFLIQVEGGGQNILNPVFKVLNGSSIYYSDETGKLYFLHAASGAFRSVVLLPPKDARFLSKTKNAGDNTHGILET